MQYKQTSSSTSKVYSTTQLSTNKKRVDITSTTSRKLSSSEQARYGLNRLGQISMIGISIIAVSVGVTISQFSVDDLTLIAPNYQVNNEFIPIDDPLDIDYIQYGESVVDNLINFIQPLGDIGQVAFNFWNDVMKFLFNPNVVQEGSFIDTFGAERFQYIGSIYNSASNEIGKSAAVYSILTETEREFLEDVNTSLFVNAERLVFLNTVFYIYYIDFYGYFGGNKWFWTMPNVITIAQELAD
jgi:hypothetical protein